MALDIARSPRCTLCWRRFSHLTCVGSLLLASHAGAGGLPPIVFTNAITLDAGSSTSPVDVGIGDFNHDTRPDFVVAGTGESRGFILVLGQASEPPFAPPQLIVVDANASSADSGQSVMVADFNNDGDLDVAFSRKNVGITISPGNGDGTFAAPITILTGVSDGFLLWPLRLSTMRLDNDNDLDLVLSDGRNDAIYVLRNDGDFVFTLAATIPLLGETQLATGDLDGDGLDDIAWSRSGNGATFAINLGNGKFATPVNLNLNPGGDGQAEAAYDIAILDIDLDGDNDMVTVHPDVPEGWITVIRNDGTGLSYDLTYHNLPIVAPIDMTYADYDGDQRIDLAVVEAGGQIWFVRNETTIPGQFEFSFPWHVEAGSGVSKRLVSANFDGDCDHDVVSIKVAPSAISLFTNISPQFSQCTIADFNFSGEVDADDLAFLLSEWGKVGSVADLDFSGRVGAWDLSILLWAWQQETP